jgi:hypothetical protein
MTPEIIIPVYEGQAFAIISCVLADGTIIDHNVELKSYKRLAKLTAASERHRIRVKEKRDKTPKVPKIPKVKPAKVEKPAIVRLTLHQLNSNSKKDLNVSFYHNVLTV